MEVRVGGKFKLLKKVGSGSFGDIYHGTLALSENVVAFLGCFFRWLLNPPLLFQFTLIHSFSMMPGNLRFFGRFPATTSC
jgi:hypothetical protein